MECEAAGSNEAASLFTKQGWIVVSASEAGPTPLARLGRLAFPLLLFSQELLALVSAGLPLVECLDALRDKETERPVRAVLEELVAGLRRGLSLSAAFELRPDIFSPVFRAAIDASEQTGEVPQALRRYIAYEQQFQILRDRLIGALMYPAVLAVLGFAVVLFLLGYVVPRFATVFGDRMQELPALSSTLVRFGLLLSGHPLQVLGALAGLALAAMWVLSHPAARLVLADAASRLPGVGMMLRHYRLSRMYRSLGMLMRGGIPVVQAMQMVADMMPVQARQAIADAMLMVRQGWPISEALSRNHLTTSVADRLLAVGDQSGRMVDMLDATAEFLDQELSRRLDRVVRLVEPVMMIFIGCIVGGIVILMYLPIFQLADMVQ